MAYARPSQVPHIFRLDRDQDHKRPAPTRLTYDHAGQSVCRVHPDLTNDAWLHEERQRIGRCIRVAREYHNLTQERVFLAVPISRSFYQEIEAGVANPSLDMLLGIARVIGVPIGDLLRYTDIQPPQ